MSSPPPDQGARVMPPLRRLSQPSSGNLGDDVTSLWQFDIRQADAAQPYGETGARTGVLRRRLDPQQGRLAPGWTAGIVLDEDVEKAIGTLANVAHPLLQLRQQ